MVVFAYIYVYIVYRGNVTNGEWKNLFIWDFDWE